ncbi:MAG: hypothetical protein CMP11_02740 [Zetaproteobacteria bacterium]|nr:hypothetical protein [Pseudobdellovibrionaceae bacterium]
MNVFLIILFLISFSSCSTTKMKNFEEKSQAELIREDIRALKFKLQDSKEDDDLVEFYFLLAEKFYLKKEYYKSLFFYQKAFDKKPDKLLATKIIKLKIQLGKSKSAYTLAKKMSLYHPNSPEIFDLLAQSLVLLGANDEAINFYVRSLSLLGNKKSNYTNLVKILYDLGDFSRAKKYLNELLSHYPNSIFAWRMKGYIYYSIGKNEKSLESFRQAYLLNTFDLESKLSYAILLIVHGKIREANELVKRVNQNSFLDSRFLFFYKNQFNLFGGPEKILALLKKTSNKDRLYFDLHLLKNIALIVNQQIKEAVQDLNRMKTQWPSSEELNFFFGLTYEKSKQKHLANIFYKKVSDRSKLFYSSRSRLLQNLFEEGKRKELQSHLNDLSQKEYIAEDLYHKIISMYGNLNDYNSALDLVNKSLLKFGASERLSFLKSFYLIELKRFEEAKINLESLIIRDPFALESVNLLVYLYTERGENLDYAEELASFNLMLRPEDPFYLDSIGWIYYKKAMYDKSLQYLLRANSLLSQEDFYYESKAIILKHIADCYLKKRG